MRIPLINLLFISPETCMSEGPDLLLFSRLESKPVEEALSPERNQAEHVPEVCPNCTHGQQHPIQPTQPGGTFWNQNQTWKRFHSNNTFF